MSRGILGGIMGGENIYVPWWEKNQEHSMENEQGSTKH